MTYKFFHSFTILFLASAIVLAGCAPAVQGPVPTTSAIPPGEIPDFIPTLTPALTENPSPQNAASPEAPALQGTLSVAFVKDGDVHLWEERNGQSRIIIEAGDVDRVTMSDDAQVIAFTRRAWAGTELEGHEQFALWAANRDGSNPREVIPIEFLRQRLNLAERDSTNFHQLGWIPGTHRAIFSITKYIVQAEGMSHAIPHGAYVVDVDSGSVTVLAETQENLRLVPSPDGLQFALLSPVGLSFTNADGSNRRQDVLTYPEAGLTGPLFPTGVWTEDSHAFVLTGSFEMDPQTMMDFTFWRVPVDGSAPVALANVLRSEPNSVTFSPDGRYASYVQATDGQPPEVAGWFIKPFDVEAGPLALPYFGKEAYIANVHWSPDGQAYAIRNRDLSPLCPDATQDTQVCGESLPLEIDSSIIISLQWVGSDRFLVAGNEPNMLVLGKLDGTFLPVATWPDHVSMSWSAALAR